MIVIEVDPQEPEAKVPLPFVMGYIRLVDVDRLQFLFGAQVLDALDEFDLDDEADRMELVERFAALPADSPQRPARMVMRTVAVSQILADDPPQTWLTAQRLRDQGLDRHEILSQLSLAVGEHLSAALSSNSKFDVDDYVEALERLPMPGASDIARRLVETARDQPGITPDDHCDAVVASLGPGGGPVLEEMVDRVLDELIEGPLWWLPGDQTVVVPDLVQRATFTHRLTDAEAELGVLSAGFDLGAFGRFDIVRLSDGTELDQFSADHHHLGWRGPQEWLARFEPGDLLACTVTVEAGDDLLHEPIEATVAIEVVADEPDISDAVVGYVRAGYDELVAEPGLPVGGAELAWWLLFHHPGLFDTAQRPLGELCAAAGLELRGGQVAHDEEIWRNDLFVRRFRTACDLVPEPDWQRVLGRALSVLDDPDASVDEVRAVLDECAEPETLDVLADVLFGHYLDPSDEFERGWADAPGRLFDLVDRAKEVAHRPRQTATAEYLACVLQERCGAADVAEEHLQRAARAQPRLAPVVERLGWYRFDRGDASGAMRWWRTLTEVPAAAHTIEPFLEPVAGGRKVGRNEPCWCGSGRKFKQCHQKATDLPPLPDRVAWLCRKASLWLEHTTGDVRGVVVELATARATGDPDVEPQDLAGLHDDEMFDMFGAAFADPIVFDGALHEGGLFGLFLHERGPLLPDDEQLLASSWRTVDRSVHEVVAVDPGVGMTLRNLGTGDVVDVRERSASTLARVGERFCARVVPDGASNQIIGGTFPVRTGQEATVLDLCAGDDPVALCAWVGALRQPPRLVHSPGLIDEMLDKDAIEAVLADFEDSDPETAMAQLQAELKRQAQAGWLDEHIPALDGLTPREAAADPTRREQLERLLAEFEAMDRAGPGQAAGLPDGFVAFNYDVAALRHELGLD